ncbi:MAG: hypothetical protein ABR517_08355 [Thermoanaerobaculia bacterium]
MKIRTLHGALLVAIGICEALCSGTILAEPIVVSGCGDITPRIAEFRSLLGDGQQINWDESPASITNTNTFSTTGFRLSTEGTSFRVSARNFSDLNPSYSSQFSAFSSPNTIAPIGSNRVHIEFHRPVRGFGMVFSDVDRLGSTTIDVRDWEDLYAYAVVPPRCDSLGYSFVGVILGDQTLASGAWIVAGDAPISATAVDVSAGGVSDLVVIDDILYKFAAPGVAPREATKYTFPVVGRTSGAEGTNFRTELTLVNQSAVPTDVLLQFQLWQGPWDYNTPLWTDTVTLAAGEQKVLDDVLKSQFDFDESLGSLQLFAPGPFVAVARIYNDRRAENQGTFGQFVDGVAEDTEYAGVASPMSGVLPALSDAPPGSGPYRTNIGFFNDGPTTANVTLQAIDVNGVLISTSMWTVGSRESSHPTAAQLFPDLGVRDNFYVTYVTDVPTLYVYASVVDNASGDAIYIPTRWTSGAVHKTFPVVGRVPGANGTSYRTDLKIVNVSGRDSIVSLEYYSGGGSGNASPSATRTIPVAAGEELVLDDVVRNQFGMETGIGALQLTATQPVIAVARIYNDQRAAGKGTFGQFVDGASDAIATRAGNQGLLPALSHSAGTHTNIGWFNGGPADASPTIDATLTLRAFDISGALLATATIAVPAYSQEQLGGAALFPGLGERENFYVTYSIDVATPLYVYASVIDNVNGDAIYIPAQ